MKSRLVGSYRATPVRYRLPPDNHVRSDNIEQSNVGSSTPKWITLGHPSYVWRFGQDRRLQIVRAVVPLERKSILDVGCGIGTYVRRFREFSEDVHGLDVDPGRVEQASKTLPNITLGFGEHLPYSDQRFDVVFLNEVIEHVDNDRSTVAECIRVLRPGGHVVIYAPNRWYPFETHGIRLGSRFVFGNIPLIGYLPDRWRDLLAPHVRAYTHRQIEGLFTGTSSRIVRHGYVYPGFDNFAARNRWVGGFLRKVFYLAEHTPFAYFGLSHFLVAQRI